MLKMFTFTTYELFDYKI
uniref:Uncharacterized protein n=1 Tax=Anguilla anguilla TaxID=7936 RepID=A0A0E9UWX1_ANGAN